jgi:hypothetical protein
MLPSSLNTVVQKKTLANHTKIYMDTEINILCIKTPQDFKHYISGQVRSFFQAVEVHANKIPIKINKRPSNPSLTQKQK